MSCHVVQGSLRVGCRGVAEDGVEAGLTGVSQMNLRDRDAVRGCLYAQTYHKVLVFCPGIAVECFEYVIVGLERADAVRAGLLRLRGHCGEATDTKALRLLVSIRWK